MLALEEKPSAKESFITATLIYKANCLGTIIKDICLLNEEEEEEKGQDQKLEKIKAAAAIETPPTETATANGAQSLPKESPENSTSVAAKNEVEKLSPASKKPMD